MQVQCHAARTFSCPSRQVFELIVDPVRFPLVFRGFGLIPAIRQINLDTPLAVGGVRRIHNADGSTLVEQITAHDAPGLHAYTLSGFRPPFSWLVRRGDARWTVVDAGSRADVRWEYAFTLTTGLAWPIAFVLLRVFMAGAMQRCLDNMAALPTCRSVQAAVTAC
jgi:hypothetical protein